MNISRDFQPFWRPEILTASETGLANALFRAHDACARRQNVSTWTVVNAAMSSGSYTSAIAAGLCTLGGKHAPVPEICDFLKRAMEEGILSLGDRVVPGWGSDFVKGEADPIFIEVHGLLGELDARIADAITDTTQALHAAGKKIYPNAGCYTAAVAIALGIPPLVSPFLFIAGRVCAWSDLILQNQPK